MNKLVLIFLVLSFNYSVSYAQDFYLGYKVGHLKMNNFSERRVQGIQLDVIFPESKLGIHYDLLWGKRYFHMPAAPIGGLKVGTAIAGSSDTISRRTIGLIVGLLLAAVPEGISYNAKIGETLELAPYISPLQYVDINDRGEEYVSSLAGSLGVRFNIFFFSRKFRFSPFIESQLLYKTGNYHGASFGVTASFRVKSD